MDLYSNPYQLIRFFILYWQISYCMKHLIEAASTCIHVLLFHCFCFCTGRKVPNSYCRVNKYKDDLIVGIFQQIKLRYTNFSIKQNRYTDLVTAPLAASKTQIYGHRAPINYSLSIQSRKYNKWCEMSLGMNGKIFHLKLLCATILHQQTAIKKNEKAILWLTGGNNMGY